MREEEQSQMDELRMLVDQMLRVKPGNALKEVSNLLEVAINIYERDFIEAYSVVHPYEYMRVRQRTEDIRLNLHYAYKRIQELKKE